MDNLEVRVEPYNDAEAKAALEGNQFKDKITDGVGEVIREPDVDIDEEEEGLL